MATVYRTSTMVAKHRFAFWRNLMCQNFVPAYGSAVDGEDFDARFTVSRLGSTTVFGMTAPMQCWDRSAYHVRRAPRDELLLTLMLSGSGRLQQDGRELLQGPGVMTLYDASLPYCYQLGGESIVVKMPRQALLSRIERPLRLAAPISSDSAIGKLAASLVRQSSELELTQDTSAARLIGASVLDVIAALIDGDEEREQSTGKNPDPTSPLDRIRTYITTHLGDPTLTVDTIARAHGISARTLARLFAASGTTPMRCVWRERLAASRRALLDGTGKRVTEVAFACGFSELSHFSRAFKSEFGVSPHRLSTQTVDLNH